MDEMSIRVEISLNEKKINELEIEVKKNNDMILEFNANIKKIEVFDNSVNERFSSCMESLNNIKDSIASINNSSFDEDGAMKQLVDLNEVFSSGFGESMSEIDKGKDEFNKMNREKIKELEGKKKKIENSVKLLNQAIKELQERNSQLESQIVSIQNDRNG